MSGCLYSLAESKEFIYLRITMIFWITSSLSHVFNLAKMIYCMRKGHREMVGIKYCICVLPAVYEVLFKQLGRMSKSLSWKVSSPNKHTNAFWNAQRFFSSLVLWYPVKKRSKILYQNVRKVLSWRISLTFS